MKRGFAILSAIIACTSNALAGEFSGTLNSQTAYGIQSHQLQQQEWRLDLEYSGELWGGDITAIGRARFDTIDSLNRNNSDRPNTYSSLNGPLISGESGELEIREFYWDKSTDNAYWRLGKQQLVWGEADGLKLLDVINPQNFREFVLDDFDDARIPLWMINAEFSLSNNGVLQVLWIPDSSTHELAPNHSDFALTSPLFVPNLGDIPAASTVFIKPAEAPASVIKDSDFGTRYTTFVNGWDLSANYLYHYVDAPTTHTQFANNTITIDQRYHRSHLLGGSASTALGDWTLRAEMAFETDIYHRTKSALPGLSQANQWSSVIGLDWQGLSDQFISLQWFQTTLLGDRQQRIVKKRENTVSFLWESKFANETLSLEWLHLHSTDHGDGLIQPELRYNYEENFDIYVNAAVFYGDAHERFGQFDQADRIALGFTWGF